MSCGGVTQVVLMPPSKLMSALGMRCQSRYVWPEMARECWKGLMQFESVKKKAWRPAEDSRQLASSTTADKERETRVDERNMMATVRLDGKEEWISDD